MKILEIAFKNINSLKGTHSIDFSAAPFTTHSLFAITGPTGSGKSTLLDVISLALFNQVPRLGKISKSEILAKGAILTRNQKDAFARITYETREGRYCSVWRISTNRNNKLRDYEMEVQDLVTGKILDLKKSDVPAKNEALIGLNYDQFIKSVVLAQGEFAQFLRAKKDERGELLEKITGTGIYRQLGIKAFHKRKEVSSEIDKEQQEIEMHQKNLLQEEERNALETRLAQLTSECEPLEKEAGQLEEKIRVKKAIREQLARVEEYLQKKEVAQRNLAAFEQENGNFLARHEKIQLFGEDLRTWRQLRSVREELETELTEVGNRARNNAGNIEDCLEAISGFLQNQPEPDQVENELQEFAGRVRKLQKQREEKIHFYRSLHAAFNAEVREVPFELNGDLPSAKEKLGKMKNEIAAELEVLQQQLSELDLQKPAEEKLRLKAALDKTRKGEQAAGKLGVLLGELSRIAADKRTIAPQLEKLPDQILLGESRMRTAEEKLQNLQLKRENEALRKSLEDHRLHLEDGQPCPLCGSQSHPFRKDLPKPEDGLQEAIVQAKKEVADLHKHVSAQQAHLKQYRERLEALEKVAALRQQELEDQRKQFKADYGDDAPIEETTWAARLTRYEEQLSQLERFEQEQRRMEAIEKGLGILADLQEVLQQGKQLKDQLDALYPGKDIDLDCRELQNKWSGLQHQKNSYEKHEKELKEKLEKRMTALVEIEKELSPRVAREGCKDIPEALERLLPEEKANTLRKKKEVLCNEAAKIEAALHTLTAQLEKLREKDLEETAENLQTDLQEKRARLSRWNKDCEELRRKLFNDQDIRKRIEHIETGVAAKKKRIRRWELLNQLIGDATGKRFNDFAQDLSLTQLLVLANNRLKVLSDRYRMDKPLPGEDDGLVAIDEHMGGQRRSVKTLSGGETFILSLSMALALSDLASRNVEINSLFIDEGFGTLDPETLDQTLDTLERLQAESSKTIGLISHVDSLKERIATQVRLTRNGQGYSTLEVTG